MKSKNSQSDILLQDAFKKGYRVTQSGDVISPTGKTLKCSTQNGYFRFSVRTKDNKVRHVMVHRFVAYQKYGEIMFQSDCVRHLNGNQKDNSFNNIEIGTNSENMFDVPPSIRRRRSIISSHKQWMKWDEDTVVEIKTYYQATHSYKKTMEKFRIQSKSTLHNILHNR